MQIHCLGTTGYHPSPTRHTACYYLPDLDLLLDAGSGLFRLIPILKSNARTELNIVLSHAHLDHIVGLTFLLNAVSVTQLRTIKVYGQSEKLAAVREHLYASDLFPVTPNFDFVDLPADQERKTIGCFDLEYFPLDHPGSSIGMVIHAQGKKIAYLTDTTPRIHPVVISRLANLDLLLHECYFEDSQVELALKTGHSWLSAVAELVKEIGPKRTLLVHVNPLAELLEMSFELDPQLRELNVSWATDGLQIQME